MSILRRALGLRDPTPVERWQTPFFCGSCRQPLDFQRTNHPSLAVYVHRETGRYACEPTNTLSAPLLTAEEVSMRPDPEKLGDTEAWKEWEKGK